MARMKLNPDQIPLITPDSNWKVPTDLPDLSKIGDVAVDTEERDNGLSSGRGPGWAYSDGYVAGVSAAWRQGGEVRSIYLPLRHPDTENLPKEQVVKWLGHVFRHCRVAFCNPAFDIGWVDQDFGIPPPPAIDDIGCMAMMLDENRKAERGYESPFSLDAIAHWCGVPGKDEAGLRDAAISYGFKGSDVKKNLWRIPARYVGSYAEQDAVATLLSAEVLRPRVIADNMLEAYRTEMDLVPMVHAMRKRGIRLDIDRAETLRDSLFSRRDKVLAELGERLNLRRPANIDELRQNAWLVRMFSQENATLHMKQSGDKQVASFEKDWMRADLHWLPRMIAEAKQCHEAATKFVQGYLLDFAHRGRIHASINQYKTEDGGTRSHRFSYADPPLQQMPSRPDPVEGWDLTETIAKEIRGAFLPEEGCLWFAPDYSQQEYRLIVHYASLLECAKAGEAVDKYNADPNTDFHNLVVEMTGLTRRRAKDVNFAKAYGAGVRKFAIMTGMSLDEAEKVMGQYDGLMPFVKELNGKCDKQAQAKGFIKLLDGARSHFDDWEPSWLDKEERSRGWSEGYQMLECRREEALERTKMKGHPWFGKRLKRAMTHKSMNRLIQGGAARQVKLAMRACWQEGYLPMIQMHDELGFSFDKEKDGKRVGEIMREVVKLRVPMRVDEEYGPTWGTAKHSFNAATKLARKLAA